jgi:two-component system LytT family response regulator
MNHELMKPIKPATCLIIDDEKLARDYIAQLLESFPTVTLIGQCGKGSQAVEQINRLAPELIFLDVEMPGLNGFEVLNRLVYRPLIIFTTAYSHYAVQAFQEYAVDYLLKPLDQDRFQVAVERALERRLSRLSKQTDPIAYLSHLFVGKAGRMIKVAIQTILYLEACGDHTVLTTHEGQYLSSLNLGRLGERLHPEEFMRIHRSTIVHLCYAQELSYGVTGSLKVMMSDGKRLSVSRNYAPLIRKQMV